LLITILIGNTFVNILISILTALFALEFASVYHIAKDIVIPVQIVTVTLILLIFGEVTPKVLSSKYPLQLIKLYTVPLYIVSLLLYPLAEILSEGIRMVVAKIAVSNRFHALSGDEIPYLATLGHEKGTIEDEEHDLIQGLVATKTKIVREIMSHRTDIFAVPYDLPFDELIDNIKNAMHSRIPVYEDNLDDIKGILYAKDILKYMRDPVLRKTFSLAKVLRKPLIVPETKLINELMREFQEKKLHIAIVVDEYGGTSGLVTLEDIIEEVVGEIRDEFDPKDEYFKKTGENSYSITGSMPIADFINEFNLEIDYNDAEYETVAGWIYEQFGLIPKPGDSFRFGNCRITVTELEHNRIVSFKLERLG
jgi:CBS domain containing-hemolysin-like protein